MAIPLIIWAGIIFVALIVLLWFFPVTLWFQAILSGVHIPLIQLVLMRWRGVNPNTCLLYTSPSPRDAHESRMPSSA